MIEHLTHEDASDLIAFLAQGRDRFKREGRQPVVDYFDQLIAELVAADEREVAEVAGFEQDLEAMSHGASEDAQVLGAQRVIDDRDPQGAGG